MITRVDKSDLLEKVKENRAQHRAIFEEAIEGYRKEGVRLLEEHIARIKNGRLERVYVQLPQPEDHTSDYDRIITMLEMSEETSIELDEGDFATFVMDDWGWKNQFLASNSSYSATAARLSGR